MAQDEILNLHILDTDIQVRSEKDQEHIAEIVNYVQNTLNGMKSKNQFANHIHIAILGCLNIAEEYFDLRDKAKEDTKNHNDELVYYKNIEKKKNEEQDGLNGIISAREEEIERLKLEHSNEIDKLKKQNDDLLNQLKSKYSQELENLKRENEKALDELANDNEHKISILMSKHSEEIRGIEEKHNKEIDRITSDFAFQNDQLVKEKDSIILNLQEERNNEIDQLTQEKDNVITRLRQERESELRSLHKDKDAKIEKLTQDNDLLVANNAAMTVDLEEKNKLLNQYRESLKQSKEENDLNRKSIIDLQNQLFENQIEMAKMQKQLGDQNDSRDNSSNNNDTPNFNEVINKLRSEKNS